MFGNNWDEVLGSEIGKSYYRELMDWLRLEYEQYRVAESS